MVSGSAFTCERKVSPECWKPARLPLQRPHRGFLRQGGERRQEADGRVIEGGFVQGLPVQADEEAEIEAHEAAPELALIEADVEFSL